MSYTFSTTVSRDTNIYTKAIGDLIEIGLNFGAIGLLFILGSLLVFLSVFGLLIVIISPLLFVITNDPQFKLPRDEFINYLVASIYALVFGCLVSGIPYIIHVLRLKEVYDKLPRTEETIFGSLDKLNDDFFGQINAAVESIDEKEDQ